MISTVLDGQHIGSIRRISAGRPAGSGSRTAAPERHAIEIEAKTGRYAHLVAARAAEGIRLRAGALPITDEAARTWQDLTALLPGAFDGRPRIEALIPVAPLGDEQGDPIAGAWHIRLSTGIYLRCSRHGQALEIVQEKAP